MSISGQNLTIVILTFKSEKVIDSCIESIKQDILTEAGEDTMTFLNKYVEQLNISVDKEKLKKLLKVLYSEATDSV